MAVHEDMRHQMQQLHDVIDERAALHAETDHHEVGPHSDNSGLEHSIWCMLFLSQNIDEHGLPVGDARTPSMHVEVARIACKAAVAYPANIAVAKGVLQLLTSLCRHKMLPENPQEPAYWAQYNLTLLQVDALLVQHGHNLTVQVTGRQLLNNWCALGLNESRKEYLEQAVVAVDTMMTQEGTFTAENALSLGMRLGRAAPFQCMSLEEQTKYTEIFSRFAVWCVTTFWLPSRASEPVGLQAMKLLVNMAKGFMQLDGERLQLEHKSWLLSLRVDEFASTFTALSEEDRTLIAWLDDRLMERDDSAFSPEHRLALDTALAAAATEMLPSTDPCNIRAWGIGRDIAAAAQWRRMGKSELKLYKHRVLDFAECVLQTFPRAHNEEDRAGLQACKIVEDMVRGCMMFSETHMFAADKQMLMRRQTVLMIRPFKDYSQETHAGIAWLWTRVNQARHESQW